MRFVSKSQNYMVVLKPGLSAQPLTGSPAKPTVSVRFKDGVADVPEGELLELMLAHPAFNADFIAVEQPGRDPFFGSRSGGEPMHVIQEIQHGAPVNKTVSKPNMMSLPPEFQAAVRDMAIAMAKEMLPGMVKETLQTLVAANKTEKPEESPAIPVIEEKDSTPAKKPGRPGRPSIKKIDAVE